MFAKRSPWMRWRLRKETNKEKVLGFLKQRRENPMSSNKDKRRIKVELYQHHQGKETTIENEYEGRLLGLIDSSQFSSLLKHKSLQSKFLTMETMKLSEITEHYKEMNGLRLAVAVKKRNGEWADKYLFVSEKLSNVSYTAGKGQAELQAGFSGSNGGWLLLTEKVV